MKLDLSKILLILLLLSLGLNYYLLMYPKVEKGKVVYLPGKDNPPIIINSLPDGTQAAKRKDIMDFKKTEAAAKELLEEAKKIPDLESAKTINSLMATVARLELSLTEKDMVYKNQMRKWQDKWNKVQINDSTNSVQVFSEIDPKVYTYSKREKFYLPKESYTVITSPNPSVKFYGLEKYVFKNPKQKDLMELNLRLEGLYYNETFLPYGGANLKFNPDGKFQPSIGYGYLYEQNNLYPIISAGFDLNLIRF